ncbi:transposase [Nocardia sp. NBC_01009]|uniref:transposase n=1 Tax=Nocardia sp. NBC_01009 TaxID=2975996 RepID=UPI0038638C60
MSDRSGGCGVRVGRYGVVCGRAGAVAAGVVAGRRASAGPRSVYAALDRGRIEVARLRRALAAVPLPRAADGRRVLAVDITCWLRPEAPTCLQRMLCHTYGRAKNSHLMIPGWPYSVVCALETGHSSWTAPLDAVRLAPGDVAATITADAKCSALAGPFRTTSTSTALAGEDRSMLYRASTARRAPSRAARADTVGVCTGFRRSTNLAKSAEAEIALPCEVPLPEGRWGGSELVSRMAIAADSAPRRRRAFDSRAGRGRRPLQCGRPRGRPGEREPMAGRRDGRLRAEIGTTVTAPSLERIRSAFEGSRQPLSVLRTVPQGGAGAWNLYRWAEFGTFPTSSFVPYWHCRLECYVRLRSGVGL